MNSRIDPWWWRPTVLGFPVRVALAAWWAVADWLEWRRQPPATSAHNWIDDIEHERETRDE